jgi:hypothetical protein
MDECMLGSGVMVFINDESLSWLSIGAIGKNPLLKMTTASSCKQGDLCVVIGAIDAAVPFAWFNQSGFRCYMLLSSRVGVVYARDDGLTRIEDGV